MDSGIRFRGPILRLYLCQVAKSYVRGHIFMSTINLYANIHEDKIIVPNMGDQSKFCLPIK